MDVFAVWAFWRHFDIDAGAYVAVSILPITTVVMGWALISVMYRLPWHSPTIVINAEGLSVFFPVRFLSSLFIRQSFIPWVEIDLITASNTGVQFYLSLKLKDPARYWSRYGRGPYRRWKPDTLTGGHINIPQMMLGSGVQNIIVQMHEKFSAELNNYEVKLYS
jgi:hypothetical protein